MAEPARDIIILGFRQSFYTKRAPRKDGKPGDVIAENAPDYWVKYTTRGAPQSMATEERLRMMDPDNLRLADGAEGGEKLAFFEYRWAQIKPAFDAWISGQALPEYGIPLAAWPALNADQVKMLMAEGIRSVEDVRDLNENQLLKIKLPNTRDLKRLAALYIDGLSNAQAAEREAEREDRIKGLEEQLAAAMALITEQAEQNATTQGGKRQKAA